MKIFSISPLLFAFFSAQFFCSAKADGYETNFAVPPYSVGASAIGIDGWEKPAFGNSSAETNAMVADAPWEPGQQALRLAKTSGADYEVRLKNVSFDPIEGVIRMTASLAFDFPVSDNRTNNAATTVAVRDFTAQGSPVSFGMDYSANGGIYYKGEGDAVVVLPKDQIKMESVYKFTIDINMLERNFSVEITGAKSDGTPFRCAESSVPCKSFGAKPFNTVYVGHNARPDYVAYLRQIGVQTLP